MLALLAQLRAESQRRMTDTATLFKKTGAEKSGGSLKPTFDDGTDVTCRWHSESGAKTIEDGKVVAKTTCTVELPAETDITVDDYITFGGIKYEVVTVPALAALDVDLVIEVRKAK